MNPVPRYVLAASKPTPFRPGVDEITWNVVDRVTGRQVHRCRSLKSAQDKARARNAMDRAALEKKLIS